MSVFEIVGHRFLADLSPLIVELYFNSQTQLTFTIREGGDLAEPGYSETVDTDMVEVAPQVYFTSWEEKSGATVTHLEDFGSGRLLSNATLPGGAGLVRMRGTLTPMDGQQHLAGASTPTANKELVRRAMHELFELGDLTALDRYWAEPYIQHTPTLPNGLDGLRAAVPSLQGFSWQPRRMVAEADLVIAHSVVEGWGPVPLAVADVFRIHDARIVEHWDVVQEHVADSKTVSGNPMV
ncbi:hypothetical protein GCM10027586_20070 [Kineococcus gypseus]|uniref:nuclear transport factor 2 family protein n=1 Tax=Kineococcus gypseus TaxID=1637102 RepID=UPI003D7F08F2